MPVLRGRPGIHQDEKSINKREENRDKEETQQKCIYCNKYFDESERDQKKLSGEDLKTVKKTDIYPDLSKIRPYVCKDCFTPECANPLDRPDSVDGKYFSIVVWFLIGLIPLLALAMAAPSAYEAWKHKEVPFKINLHKASELEEYFDENLYKIEQKYPVQEEQVWYTLGGGIKYVLKNEPNRPSVFMFLYDSESAENTAKCLAKDVSYLASVFLKRDTKKKPVLLTGSEMNEGRLIEDPGKLLVDYNRTVRDNGAMVITNLQDVPPEVATSLHFFCDAYSPLVETAVYIFTLKVDNIPNYQRSDTARDKLNELWSTKMPHGTIEALITRITPNVLRIKSDIADC